MSFSINRKYLHVYFHKAKRDLMFENKGCEFYSQCVQYNIYNIYPGHVAAGLHLHNNVPGPDLYLLDKHTVISILLS